MQVTVDGLDIEVHEKGVGPPVMLVHGSASDRRTWDPLIERLAGDARLLSYSRRYHWPNPPASGDAEYAMSAHVDDLMTVIAGVTPEPINVVGHSYGGLVSLMLALRHPGMVRRQVLIEPPVVPLFVSDPPKPAELLKALVTRPRLGAELVRFEATGLAPARKAADSGEMDKALTTLARAMLGRRAFKELPSDRWRQAQANNNRTEYRVGIFDPLTDDQIRHVTTPTLLLSGADGVALWRLLSDRLDELLPTSEHVRIPGACHIVHEDQPDAVAERILEFLAD